MSDPVIQLNQSTLTLKGDITLVKARSLNEQVEQLLHQASKDIVMDLAGVEKFDSTICVLLLTCYRTLRRQQRQLNCINIPDSLKDISKMYDLDQVLPFLAHG